MAFRTQLLKSWQEPNLLTWILLPLSWLYQLLFWVRRIAFKTRLLKSYRASIPVIVVGNLTVGGTGKTPMVIYLVELLKKSGYKPGVISRGYSGVADSYPLLVTADTPVHHSGDEPALIVKRTNIPMMVGPNRAESIQNLVAKFGIDIIISDDGLQHLAMQRDIEICLQDSTKNNHNTHLLPAGPYRESLSRLNSVDMVVRHQTELSASLNPPDYEMSLVAEQPQPIKISPEQAWKSNTRVHAVAGIGNPDRFFDTCRALGFDIIEHAFADHHQFGLADITFNDELPVLMTEKDAVKCLDIATQQHWYLPVNAKLSNGFDKQLLALLGACDKSILEK